MKSPTAADQSTQATFGGMIDVWGIESEKVDIKEMILKPSL
jgi:hypothetical protein